MNKEYKTWMQLIYIDNKNNKSFCLNFKLYTSELTGTDMLVNLHFYFLCIMLIFLYYEIYRSYNNKNN